MPPESPLSIRKIKIAPNNNNNPMHSDKSIQNAWNSNYRIICDKHDHTVLTNTEDDNKEQIKDDHLQLLSPQKYSEISIIIGASTNGGQQLKKDVQKSKFAYLQKYFPWNVPWVLVTISVLQIFIFLLDDSRFYKLLIYSPIKQNEAWRFLTYTFLHADAVHLMLNVVIQILVSLPLETEQGHIRVLFIYFGGVLSGAMGASIIEPTLMVGASAGVYCLLMSHISNIIINFTSLSHPYFRCFAVATLSISDLVYSIRHCLTKGNSKPKIGIAAHICGAASGILLGFAFYKSSKTVILKIFKYTSIVLYCCWIIIVILLNCLTETKQL